MPITLISFDYQYLLLIRGYRGTVRRVLGNTNPVWFEADSPRDCENVPEQVNAGKPPRDICALVRFSIQFVDILK